jgi:uncharacterized protein (DUF1684 family)
LKSFLVIVAFLAISCSRYGQAPIPPDYESSLEAWKQVRHTSLTNPTGWMRLSGMIWMENGVTTFLDGLSVERRDSLVFHADTLLFNGPDSPIIESGTHRWRIIQRTGLIGIRIWNTENAEVDAFTGFPRYATDTTFVRVARFIPNPEGTTLPIVNILGKMEQIPSPGILEFDLDGETQSFHALDGGAQMFIIFGDATNRTETYQAGRFLYIDYPIEGEDRTVIDFNKAYNPPCAFSEFTTCQLPPDQNVLTVSVTAGEKRPK